MYYDVVSAKYLHDYQLEIIFNDGTKGTADFSDYAKRGGVFSNFQDIDFFKKVFINMELGVLTWPGDIDIAPETVYTKVTGKPLKKAI
jgi:hypothetical protein